MLRWQRVGLTELGVRCKRSGAAKVKFPRVTDPATRAGGMPWSDQGIVPLPSFQVQGFPSSRSKVAGG